MDKLPELLTVSQAAEFLQCHRSWVYARTRDNSIPCIRIGGLLRIPREKLIMFFQQNEAGGISL